MPVGLELAVGIAYSVTVPVVVIHPDLVGAASVNQRLPSGAGGDVAQSGARGDAGRELVTVPVGVIGRCGCRPAR